MAFYSGLSSGQSKLPVEQQDALTSPLHSQLHMSASSPDILLADHELIGPAIDGPPSPERLRQLTRQMKRASYLRRPPRHRPAASASSSLTSLADNHSTWEQDLENMTRGLTRRSSNRSTGSSTPSRERADSMQVFGKPIFHRRERSKRGNDSQSSSNSSLYSMDASADSSWFSSKESFIPTIFSRRKPSRDESAVPKRPQISVPFNFQHVAHTNRDSVSDVREHSLYMNAKGSFLSVAVSEPTSAPATLTGKGSEESHAFSSELLDKSGDDDISTNITSRPPLVLHHTTPASGHQGGLMKHVRSQEQLRLSSSGPPPPRPPRSPMSTKSFAPPPPPRVSSRQTLNYLGTVTSNSAAVNGAVCRPRPFGPSHMAQPTSPTMTSRRRSTLGAVPGILDTPNKRSSGMLAVSPDTSWPLVTPASGPYETALPALPDVPEEEEHHVPGRQSRLSLVSNNSSLRGSYSVPMLRTLAESQRPISGASETLGHSDLMTAQQKTIDEVEAEQVVEEGQIRESWEDDIDYCYEHEVEADCDYRWERPSLDFNPFRRSVAPPTHPDVEEGQPETVASTGETRETQPCSRHASDLDMQPQGHKQQASITVADLSTSLEALTTAETFRGIATPPADEVNASRFSSLKQAYRDSVASSFKVPDSFTISPSLLIPKDYHKEAMMYEAEQKANCDVGDLLSPYSHAMFNEEDFVQVNGYLTLPTEQRCSTSTTETNFSSNHSNSTSGRHESTNSSWTSFTRLTASSTELKQLEWSGRDAAEPVPTAMVMKDASESVSPEINGALPEDTLPELDSLPVMFGGKKSYHKSNFSESVVRTDLSLDQSHNEIASRRPRARTTSLSAQSPPPVGQYALFPKAPVARGFGGRI